MPGKSPFAEDWRDCLEAHFVHVVRAGDVKNEQTLSGVLMNAGFVESELVELKIRATMRVEDVGEDFVPDMSILTPEPPPPAVIVVEPVVAAIVEPEPEPEPEAEPEPLKRDEEGPVQLSLF